MGTSASPCHVHLGATMPCAPGPRGHGKCNSRPAWGRVEILRAEIRYACMLHFSRVRSVKRHLTHLALVPRPRLPSPVRGAVAWN